MNNLKITKLTVAKICHEIANCLSVMKFLQEDFRDSSTHKFEELCKEIDTLINITDFFRNIYSMSDCSSSSKIPLINILKLKKIILCDKDDVLKNSFISKIICGIIYIMMKVCKPGDNIIITKEDENVTTISINNSRIVSTNILNALNSEPTTNEDVFNVFAMYVRAIATGDNYDIQANINRDHILSVKIWKK